MTPGCNDRWTLRRVDVTSPGRNDVDVASCGCKSCFVDVASAGRNVAWM